MTAQVIPAFEHAFNTLEVAEQEYEMAKEDYREACRNYSGLDRKRVSALEAASQRREQARAVYWKLKGWC